MPGSATRSSPALRIVPIALPALLIAGFSPAGPWRRLGALETAA